MRIWDLSGPEVAAADASAWDGPLAGAMRPFTTKALVRLLVTGAVLSALSGIGGLVLVLTARSRAEHVGLAIDVNTFNMMLGAAIVGMLLAISPRVLRFMAPSIAFGLIVFAPVLATLALTAGGPAFGVAAANYVQAPLFAFYLLRRPWAVACAISVLTCTALLVVLQDGWVAPFGIWVTVFASVIATAALVGQIAERADLAAASERAARLELDELNHTLEDRVAAQVTEIERLSGLRRFLSPQVADVVLSADFEELSRPHRRRIAVFFCDLRGFTAFTNHTEPEEVVIALDEYYRAVGGLLQQYGATVGDYAGDGIMAYFGDPVPREDSAAVAVEMTRDVGHVMAGVVEEWNRRGHDLHYGVGLAFGFATLGVVGFDGRYDYKPVGGVVNLAARLCAKAQSGQVLLDHPTYVATSGLFASERLADLELKGYDGPLRAYVLT